MHWLVELARNGRSTNCLGQYQQDTAMLALEGSAAYIVVASVTTGVHPYGTLWHSNVLYFDITFLPVFYVNIKGVLISWQASTNFYRRVGIASRFHANSNSTLKIS